MDQNRNFALSLALSLLPISVSAAQDNALNDGLMIAAGAVLGIAGVVFWLLWRRERWHRKIIEVQLNSPDHFDPVTGLPGRQLFDDRFRHALSRHGRNQTDLGLLLLRLEHFYGLSQKLGNDGSDALIRSLAQKWQGGLRRADTLARLEPDQFVVLLDPVLGSDGAKQVAQTLIEVTQAHLQQETGSKLDLTIGIALFPQHGLDGVELLRAAHDSMLKAGKHGQSGYRVA
ncbi:diguanylate cyclase domain-containing protein [Ferrimonas pelagia]|uniref:GGDEF domain-containing protein n=1 Tax=Ferrimonas pelagia TaxID=1177826 RepID=A0ABP9EKJ1_9GAMM